MEFSWYETLTIPVKVSNSYTKVVIFPDFGYFPLFPARWQNTIVIHGTFLAEKR